MKVLLTHPGTQYAPRLAAALQHAGILYRFATGIAFADTPEAWWWQLARRAGKEKLLRKRVIPGLPAGKLHLQPVKEAIALFRHQQLRQSNDAVFFPRNRAFQQQLPQRLIDAADMVIGFDTSSWILAERCAKAGKPFVLDASIAHPHAKEAVYAGLRSAYPAWAAELAPKAPELIAVELEEIARATHIVVASQFTRHTYIAAGVPPEKISVNAYGTQLDYFTSKWEQPETTPPTPEAGIRFLFFGALSARKGFPWLCRVWEQFHRQYPRCTLRAAGYNLIPDGFAVPAGVEVVGPVHPADRAALFAGSDVFVFPSFFEGFAQVLLEAMACGLPVITTTATAGPDLMTTGTEGRLIAPGDDAALSAALQFFATRPQEIPAMGRAATAAAAAYSWEAYGSRWKAVAARLVSGAG